MMMKIIFFENKNYNRSPSIQHFLKQMGDQMFINLKARVVLLSNHIGNPTFFKQMGDQMLTTIVLHTK